MIFCWVITIIGACLGALVLVYGFSSTKGVPPDAAAAAVALALAVVPYCFTRDVEGIGRETRRSAEHLEDPLVIRNIGNGPALFVRLEDLRNGLEVRFEMVDVIPRETVVFVASLRPSSANNTCLLTVRYSDVYGTEHWVGAASGNGRESSFPSLGKAGLRLMIAAIYARKSAG